MTHSLQKANRTLWTILLVLAALVLAVILVPGCNGVILSPAYSTLLDKTATLSSVTADMADANALTPEQMKASLRGQAKVWQAFRDARDGKAGAK